MCTGKHAFAAQKKQYARDVKQRRITSDSEKNIWSMKNDQYTITSQENVRAYSTAIGAVQRNFGNEVSSFLENYKSVFTQSLANAPVDEGDRSRSFGRSSRLQELYSQGMLEGNLRRADIKQTEDLRQLNRTLMSRQNQALGKRGFAPVPSVAPAKPVGPSMLDQGIQIASTAAMFIAPLQALGGAAGIGAKGGGFLNKFFQGGSNVTKAITPTSFMTGQSSWYGQ